MKRSNLIPITRIYDIYPKYTYSVDVKKFMDEIVDIDRANVYTKNEVIVMLENLDLQIDEMGSYNREVAKVQRLIRDRIVKLKEDKE